MKAAIQQRALELGFDDCRFTTAQPPPHTAALENWLAGGQHGEMAWLARNAEKRLDPQRVLPGAATIITLATSYAGPDAATPDSAGTGIVARYARHADYHDVLGEVLTELNEFIIQLGGGETRALWYVDTGPLLERDLAERAGLGFAGKHNNLNSRLGKR